MRIANLDIMPNGDVRISEGLRVLFELWNNDDHHIIVTDCRTLVDSAQYQIGWHDGYRAHFNDENNKQHDTIEERMRHNAT